MTLQLLIADDDPDDARLVAYRVKRAGFAVEWRRVDDEPAFTRELPTADLVICDFSMPSFSPVRALEVIRELGLTTPLLLVSGSVSAAWVSQILGLGAVGYLSKDKLGGLDHAVRDALGGRAPIVGGLSS
jgi:DNA-binding NarL/FixJ family response regulator